MMLKNTVRILFSNFSTVWKSLLFKVIVFLLAGIIVLPSFLKINTYLVGNNLWVELESIFSFYNLTNNLPEIFDRLFSILSAFEGGIVDAFSQVPFHAVFFVFGLFILLPFLYSLSDYATGECLFGSMGSGAKFGFTASFIGNLGNSICLQGVKTAILAPFTIAVLFVSERIYLLFQSHIHLQFLMPIAILSFACVAYSLAITVISGWTPAMVVHNNGVFKSFLIGFKATSRKFFKIFGDSLSFVFIQVVTFLLLGPWGIVVLCSLFSFILLIFEMVAFFETTGMRYYIDFDAHVIITPKKPQEIANISKLKRVI